MFDFNDFLGYYNAVNQPVRSAPTQPVVNQPTRQPTTTAPTQPTQPTQAQPSATEKSATHGDQTSDVRSARPGRVARSASPESSARRGSGGPRRAR